MVGAAEERSGLVDRVHEVGDGAPPGLGSHLEQAEAVVVGGVPVVGVVPGVGVDAGVGRHPQIRLRERGHERDLQPITGDPFDLEAGLDDGGGVGELDRFQRESLPVSSRHLQ